MNTPRLDELISWCDRERYRRMHWATIATNYRDIANRLRAYKAILDEYAHIIDLEQPK